MWVRGINFKNNHQSYSLLLESEKSALLTWGTFMPCLWLLLRLEILTDLRDPDASMLEPVPAPLIIRESLILLPQQSLKTNAINKRMTIKISALMTP